MRRVLLLAAVTCVASDDGLISKLSANHNFTTGIIWSKEGFLLFADSPSGKIFKVDSAGTSVLHDGLNGPMGLAVDNDGDVWVCETGARRVIHIDKNKRVQVMAERYDGKRFNGPNDIAVRGNHVYFTDPAFASALDTRELPHYGVYYLTPKGVVTLLAKTAGRPNGIAISADGKTLYVADSDARSILAYTLSNPTTVSAEKVILSGIKGVPDGIHLDKAGNLYVCARDVSIYSPTGKLIREIPLSEKPSSVTLGDGDLQTLYIAARTSVYQTKIGAQGQTMGAHH